MKKEAPKYYHSKYPLLAGSTIDEITPKARKLYNALDKQTGRRMTYIRSAYFNNDKIFLQLFWEHLHQKQHSDRARRLKFYQCALDLIRNTRFDPDFKDKAVKGRVTYYRYYGKAKSGESFIVQIYKDKRGNKYFLSCFPEREKSI
ncbi:MAG: hypothetical protein LBR44_10630 [Clostridiales Family XIII bacterium]|jgi:hypothetical protein|nr:hypothetical protein [Clostridiales Family XIII bacterium]